MRPMLKEDMDVSMARGCGHADCTHQHDKEPMWIHGRCHVEAGCSASYHEGTLSISCAECAKIIVAMRTKEAPAIVACSKHPKASLEIAYLEGEVMVQCEECQKTIQVIQVIARNAPVFAH